MAQDELAVLLRQVLSQMEAQQQALVNLTAVLDRYLAVPVKVDANNSPVSFKEGSAVSVNNKPTVIAEQSKTWSVDLHHTPPVKSERQPWEVTLLIGPDVNSASASPALLNGFIDKCSTLGSQGWELTNITGFLLFIAAFKRPR